MLAENISVLKQEIGQNVELVVVSKYRTIEEIKAVYETGQRLFAENRVQALLERYEALPKDIRWHLIGHLQSNKIKYIIPFIDCIQSVDSLKLLKEINRLAKVNSRKVDCLLQIHIAEEETKFGLDNNECKALISLYKLGGFENIRIRGLMGMATNTEDKTKVKKEFNSLKQLFEQMKSEFELTEFDTLSMGMSSDYKEAIECGSTMVRVGSKVFDA